MSGNVGSGRAGDFAGARALRLTTDEEAFAWRKHRQGVSTFAIANMLRRPQTQVAAIFVPIRKAEKPRQHFPPRRLTQLPSAVRDVILRVAAYYGVSPEDILGTSTAKREAHPRQAVYWAIYELRTPRGQRRYSLPQIAKFLGRADHTSALHGIRRHEQRLAEAEAAEARDAA
jgi:hypothetical protein